MTKRTGSRARRTALVTAVATVALCGSFGTAVHADDEPVAEPPVETGQTDDGATVAVGTPPIPPVNPPVVAVGTPPVPPVDPPVVAVGTPPVPLVNPPVVAVGTPPVPPTPPVATAQTAAPAPAATASAEPAPAARPHGVRQAPSIDADLADVLAGVIARIEAALALIDSRT